MYVCVSCILPFVRHKHRLLLNSDHCQNLDQTECFPSQFHWISKLVEKHSLFYHEWIGHHQKLAIHQGWSSVVTTAITAKLKTTHRECPVPLSWHQEEAHFKLVWLGVTIFFPIIIFFYLYLLHHIVFLQFYCYFYYQYYFTLFYFFSFSEKLAI